jgi:hypothetical protein
MPAATLLACLSAPLHAQSSSFSGEVALASQLVDQGLAITPDTPILQGAVSWASPTGWSFGLAGGAELRSPSRPVVVLARVSRAWAPSGDWLAQASLLYYGYRSEGASRTPDRAHANLYFTYRDTLTFGVSAIRVSGNQDQRLLGAVDVNARWPLSDHVSLSAGAGIAQASVRSHGRGPYAYRGHGYGYDHLQLYGYGSLGLAWSDGSWRLQVDRNMNSLGARRAYGNQAPHWVATVSRSF